MKAKKIIGRLLLAFVLVSIGFAAGREIARRSGGPGGRAGGAGAASTTSAAGTRSAPDAGGAGKVVVYYMHTTFRCITCNRIEALAESVVKGDFAEALGAGRVEWKTLDFQEHDDLAKRYGVGTSTVVVVKVRGGREVAFKRLDEVWTKVNDADAFSRYVSGAVREMLAGDGS